MTAPAPSPSPADPALRDMLTELAGLGVAIARAAAATAETEARVVGVLDRSMPERLGVARSLDEAQQMGGAVDAVDLALAQASPRIAAAAASYERVSRAVRRTVALAVRLDAGWPRRGACDAAEPDTRAAMARRHIARAVGERITAAAEGEAAERLFADLARRLDAVAAEGGLDLPTAMVIRAVCRDLGLPPPLPEGAAPAPSGRPDG